MKKVIGLIVVALAVCVAVVAVLETRSVSAGISPGPYKCYQARHAKGTDRFRPARIFITDQFRHNVEVSVQKLSTHCSTANQELYYDGSAAGFQQGLDCYTVRDAPRQERFRSQNIVVRDKLINWNEQSLTVSKLQSLCTISLKNTKFTGTLEGEALVCYQARTAKGQPRFQQRDMLINDNYSRKEVRVIRPVAYCSRAEKKVDASDIDDFENQTAHGNLPEANCGSFSPLSASANVIQCEDHVSTVHATLDDNDPIISCKTDYTHSVWYHWNANGNYSVIVDTEGTTYDTVVAVFTGDKGDLDEVACNDDVDLCDLLLMNGAASGPCGPCENGTGAGGGCVCARGSQTAGDSCCVSETGSAGRNGDCSLPQSRVQFDAWDGTTYHILVASSEGRGGKLKFAANTKVDNRGDSCGNPEFLFPLEFIGDGYTVHHSTMNATSPTSSGSAAGDPVPNCSQQDPDVNCAGEYGSSVWFTYTPTSHQLVNFDVTTSSYLALAAVFDTETDTQISCGAGFTAALKAGHKYLILVASVDEEDNFQGGKLKLDLFMTDELGGPPSGRSTGVTDQGTPDSITCYQVRQARHSNQTEYIWDQFSIRQFDNSWSLIIGGVDSVCVPSNKETCTGFNFPNGVGEAAQICNAP